MTFTQYALTTQRLREEWARTTPTTFLLFETGRYAAAMAMVLSLGDLTPLAYATTPLKRIGFIVTWSIAMAVWTLWRARRSKTAPPQVIPPAI